MKSFNKKALALLVTAAMIGSFAGCGKDTSAEESLQAELDELRAQLEAQETAENQATDDEDTEESEETEAVEETVEETEADGSLELRSWDLPFSVADGTTNLSLGQIAGNGDVYFSVVGVRVLDDIETQVRAYYQYDLPNVEAGKVVVYPIIQVYNASEQVQTIYQQDIISLYADSVQVSPIDLDGDYFSIDSVTGFYCYKIDPGHSAQIVFPFIVSEGWSEITVFCTNFSWTFTQDDVSSEPYDFVSVFNQAHEYTEPGSVIYSCSDYELVLDGVEVDTTTYTRSVAVFEFTINNLTSDILEIELPVYMRGYSNDRLVYSSTGLQDEFDGHTNAYSDEYFSDDIIEIHPGMSSRFYIAYVNVAASGSYECCFETDVDGVVAQVCVEVQ